MHGETLLLIILDDSCWAISPLPGKMSCSLGDDTRRQDVELTSACRPAG
jgi:hypothetical protein